MQHEATIEKIIETIRTNYNRINAQIAQAASRAGRSADDVRLLVVTKAQALEIIEAAYSAGVRLFGENYPEETEGKILALQGKAGVEWHMIGHLQSRKSRIVAAHFDWLHSLDSLALAERLDRQLGEAKRILPVLLQVNVSGEESKGGWPAWGEIDWEDLRRDFDAILSLANIRVRGLMTMPPLFDNPEEVRPYFVRARRLRDWLAARYSQAEWNELSMGTSSDFPIAVEEGATIVRVGTAIVGPRPPKK